MDSINLFSLVPKFDIDKGGTVYTNYIQLYQDFINDIVASNEDIYTIFDCRLCDEKYLPYLAQFLGYTWDYEGDIETQRYELLSYVEREKRTGTLWFFEDMFRILGITVSIRELIHYVLTLSGPGTLSGDSYIEGLEKYHEGSIEFIVDHTEITGLYDLILASLPAGIHLHVTFS